MKSSSRIIYYVSEKLEKFFPDLERNLRTSGMDTDKYEYISSCLKKSIIFGIGSSAFFLILGIVTRVSTTISIGIFTFPVVAVSSLLTLIKVPKIRTKRKARKLDEDLQYALRDILIEVKSGVPFFSALKSSTSGYGEVSEEMSKIVKNIEGGKAPLDAIEDSIVRSPSERYRQSMWQLSSSIKSGTDIERGLESVVDSIVEEQKIDIKKYGEELNSLILVYLLIAVVGPSLGITAMIIMSSFTGIDIDRSFFYITIGLIVVVQTSFLNLIKSRRPKVKV
jgi:flagellar protein FlaJ